MESTALENSIQGGFGYKNTHTVLTGYWSYYIFNLFFFHSVAYVNEYTEYLQTVECNLGEFLGVLLKFFLEDIRFLICTVVSCDIGFFLSSHHPLIRM